MTPVAFTAAFCCCLSLVATARLVRGDPPGDSEIGTALIAGGITVVTVLWALVDTGGTLETGHWLLSLVAVGIVLGGIGLIVGDGRR